MAHHPDDTLVVQVVMPDALRVAFERWLASYNLRLLRLPKLGQMLVPPDVETYIVGPHSGRPPHNGVTADPSPGGG